MEELKRKTMDVVDRVNQDWVEELQEAQKEGRWPDLTGLMGKFSNNIKNLDTYFREAEERIRGKKKKW